jgi:hypothetical protein
MLVALLGQRHGALLLVEFEISGFEPGDEGVDGIIEVGPVVERT